MKSTLKRELKAREIVKREANRIYRILLFVCVIRMYTRVYTCIHVYMCTYAQINYVIMYILYDPS
jgi:hypothetical protein